MKNDFNAIPWDKAKVGICVDDLERIKVEQGNWVDINYGGKKMSAIAQGVQRNTQWQKDYSPIFINENQAMKKLKIPSIRGHNAMNHSAVNLEVSKRSYPPITATWPAFATLVLLLAGILFKGIAEAGDSLLGLTTPQTQDVKNIATLVLVVLAVIGAISSAYEVYKKQQ